ncbi:MAG TPA: RNA polymerase sigma factor [Chitinophagaceae bacterium]|nr:RNA polymerase sigma factor [Chitinophagaceae bacterium]
MPEKAQTSIPETIRQYGKKLFGFIRSKVNSPEDSEDILQEVWYQLSALTNLDAIENMGAWLYRVARNKVIDKYRKSTTVLFDDLSVSSDDDEDDGLDIKNILLADESKDPSIKFFKEQFWNELMAALDELPEKQREVFLLNEIEELTLQQIADQCGENIKTIISRKGYAVKHLRERLQGMYQELAT